MGEDSVMTIAARGRATVVTSTFHSNSVSSATPETVAAGPVMRLQSRIVEDATGSSSTKGSAAWFMDCTFTNSSAEVPGEIAMDDSNSSVFTNGALPSVWHLNKSEEIAAITVAESIPEPISGPRGQTQDVFASVSARLGQFPRSDNPSFRALVEEQERLTGLQPAVLPQSPTGTDLALVQTPEFAEGPASFAPMIFPDFEPLTDLSPVEPEEVAEDPGTFSLGALVGVVMTVLVLLLLAACCIWRQRKRRAKAGRAQGVRLCKHRSGRDPHKVIMHTCILARRGTRPSDS